MTALDIWTWLIHFDLTWLIKLGLWVLIVVVGMPILLLIQLAFSAPQEGTPAKTLQQRTDELLS
jgi:hypothetical protein